MRKIVEYLIDRIEGKTPKGEKRSDDWPEARRRHLNRKPACAVCGRTDRVQVHHIIPFFLDRSKELDEKNFITLCARRKVLNCHLVFGHLGHFKCFNPSVVSDAAQWRLKLARDKS